MNEIRPLVDVALPWQARLWHFLNLPNGKHVIPNIDICQHSDECLGGFKATSNRILLLSQYEGASRYNGVASLDPSPLRCDSSIFVKFPWARGVFPWCTDVVPFAIICWYRGSPTIKKRCRIENLTKAIIFITRVGNSYKKHVCLLTVEHNVSVTMHSKLNLNKQQKWTTLIGMVSRSPFFDVPVHCYQAHPKLFGFIFHVEIFRMLTQRACSKTKCWYIFTCSHH